MERSAMEEIGRWYDAGEKKCLMIDGARGVGKTYLVREFAKRRRISLVEINLLEDGRARSMLSRAKSADDVLKALDLLCDGRLVPRESVVFFDEVQECLSLVTEAKFLVEDGRFRYILSGSLLGVEIGNVRSFPVGYMHTVHMYPMDFAEFLTALGYTRSSLDRLEECFLSVEPVDGDVHEIFMKRFREYLIVGGMPAAVQRFADTGSFSVADVHEDICEAYREDITKYEKTGGRPRILDVFERIPDELAKQNKRFHLNSVGVSHMTGHVENAFLKLTDAGVALPVYCVDEPRSPLRMGESRNLLKLFMCDVGLLTHMFSETDDLVRIKIYDGDRNVSFGAVYENFVAQELKCHGLGAYYYNSKKYGEIDLLTEIGGEAVPVEVKSGKGYKRHSALNGVMSVPGYGIGKAYVFSDSGKIEERKGKIHMPVYMATFLRRRPPEGFTTDFREDVEKAEGLLKDM